MKGQAIARLVVRTLALYLALYFFIPVVESAIILAANVVQKDILNDDRSLSLVDALRRNWIYLVTSGMLLKVEPRLIRWLVPAPRPGCQQCGYPIEKHMPVCPECGTNTARSDAA